MAFSNRSKEAKGVKGLQFVLDTYSNSHYFMFVECLYHICITFAPELCFTWVLELAPCRGCPVAMMPQLFSKLYRPCVFPSLLICQFRTYWHSGNVNLYIYIIYIEIYHNLYDLCQTSRMPKFYAPTTVGGNQKLKMSSGIDLVHCFQANLGHQVCISYALLFCILHKKACLKM